MKRNIDENFPFLKEKKLLIACSGGLDSTVLAYLMKSLEFQIALAHCNFSLRGKESDGDEMFTVGLAKKMEIPVFAETFETKKYAAENKVSTQMAARDLRYHWFGEILKNFGYDYVLTAHHLDDDLETFLINLSRGSGLQGLTGIPFQNEKIIRPFLNVSREEIFEYAKENKISWREDSSNAKPDYLRNKLRLDVIPQYKEAANSLLRNFQKSRQNLRASQHLVEDYMALVYKLIIAETADGYSINIEKLQELPHPRAILFELLSGFGFTAWEDVYNLLEAQTGKRVFSETHQLLKNRDLLFLSEISSEENFSEFEISKETPEISEPIRLKFETEKYIGETEKNIAHFDFHKLKFPLKLRKWQEGDQFQPFGMKGKKKLSKFFKDEKLSLSQKDKIWLLTSNNQVIWVIGHRMDERFKVTETTSEIFKITYFKEKK
nr:tRNA lysidine(34) synthetase TilS [Aequorivita echinoideorum]